MRSVDLHLVPGGASVGSSPSEHGDPRERVPEGPGHSVQFYENEAFLAAAVADFVADGVAAEEPVLVLATVTHRRAFVRRLRAKGIDVEQARADGLLTWCDAEAMLARIMAGPQPDEERFRAELIPLLEQVLVQRTAAEWVEALVAAGIPAGPINFPDETLTDEHVLARRMIVELEHPLIGVVRSIAAPMRFESNGPTYRRYPPRLGEHNDEIRRAAAQW